MAIWRLGSTPPVSIPYLLLFLLALAVRLIFADNLPFPGLDDPPFYLTVARNLSEGRGFTIDAIWTYLVPHQSVTHPSNELWMPLPSLVIAPFFALFGPYLQVAQWVGAITGALLAPLTWALARTAFPPGWQGTGFFAAVLVALNPLLAYQSVSSDSSVYFAILGAAAILAGSLALRRSSPPANPLPPVMPTLRASGQAPEASGGEGRPLPGFVATTRKDSEDAPIFERAARSMQRGSGGQAPALRPWLEPSRLKLVLRTITGPQNEISVAAVAAGLLAGFAYLARPEGALLALTLSAVTRRPAVLIAAAAVALPWLIRNYVAFGAPVPVPATTLALLPDYSALFQYGAGSLAVEPGQQVSVRVEALAHSLALVFIQALFPIAPLAVAGAVAAWRAPALRTGLTSLAVIFLATALLFPVPSIHGTFYHAVGAFIPLLTILAVHGLARMSRNIGRLLFQDSDFPVLLFQAAAVLLTLVQLMLAMSTAREAHAHWGEQFGIAARWLQGSGFRVSGFESGGPRETRSAPLETAEQRPGAQAVMTNEPHTLHYASGVPTLMLPWGGPPESAREAAARYGASYVVGFGRPGTYPDVLEGVQGFTKVFEDGSVWVYQIGP